MIRMIDPDSFIVSTMINGVCREDYTRPPQKMPFEIKLR